MTTRFAPSPTGFLHLGHAYAARVARDLACDQGGTFLLRFEDIDHTRVRPEYYAAIEEDCRWLGITWAEEPIRQSQRLDAYGTALDQLRRQGLVYPCFCTRREIREELLRIANAPHGPEGPLYPGTCRCIPAGERTARLAAGKTHCWRLDAAKAGSLHPDPLTFTDEIHGTVPVDSTLLGDVILARKDIATSYHLAVVVDDAFQGITHVTRGNDLLSSSHVHRLLQSLLGFPEPAYHHHHLLTGPGGRRLAKRERSTTLRDLRQDGYSPDDVLSLLPSGNG